MILRCKRCPIPDPVQVTTFIRKTCTDGGIARPTSCNGTLSKSVMATYVTANGSILRGMYAARSNETCVSSIPKNRTMDAPAGNR
jgi:hypothetical protein